MLMQRTDKLTSEDAIDLAHETTALIDLAWSDKALFQLLRENLITSSHMRCCDIVSGLGDPLVNVEGMQFSPGLWLLDDHISGITFAIWSDGHKQNPVKGTFVEALLNEDQVDYLAPAYARLVEHLTLLMRPNEFV